MSDEAQKMKEGRLLPCPFCGGENTNMQPGVIGDVFYGHCMTCGTIGPRAKEKSNATLAWNKRQKF